MNCLGLTTIRTIYAPNLGSLRQLLTVARPALNKPVAMAWLWSFCNLAHVQFIGEISTWQALWRTSQEQADTDTEMERWDVISIEQLIATGPVNRG